MNDKMYRIRKRFPDKSKTIALLIAEDSEFHVMCEDYDDCVQACGYWGLSKEPEAENRVNEYRTIIKALEMEIVAVLNKSAYSIGGEQNGKPFVIKNEL